MISATRLQGFLQEKERNTCSTGPEKRPKLPQLKTPPYNHIESNNIKLNMCNSAMVDGISGFWSCVIHKSYPNPMAIQIPMNWRNDHYPLWENKVKTLPIC